MSLPKLENLPPLSNTETNKAKYIAHELHDCLAAFMKLDPTEDDVSVRFNSISIFLVREFFIVYGDINYCDRQILYRQFVKNLIQRFRHYKKNVDDFLGSRECTNQ